MVRIASVNRDELKSVQTPVDSRPVSEAWLFRGARHRPPALHGRLQLNDEVVRFEIDHVGGPFDDSGVALLTEQTGDPTAYERVSRGEAITLLDVERRNAKIRFPFLGVGITMSVELRHFSYYNKWVEIHE